MSSANCNVCTEKFNKSTRLPIQCECGYKCCKQCTKTYILNIPKEASCMACHNVWTKDFLFENLDKKFLLHDYKLHYYNILFLQETHFFEETQPLVEKEIQIEKIEKEIKTVTEQYNLKLQALNIKLKTTHQENPQPKQFIERCPQNDCRGFLYVSDSQQLLCGVCENAFCNICQERMDTDSQDHVCDQQTVESLKVLKKETKKCPKCFACISKIDGCNQMYCVRCHIAFDWDTLKIEYGTIHNPHFFEAQRTKLGYNPRNPLDVQCGREIDAYFVSIIVTKYGKKLPDGWRRIFNQEGHLIYYDNPELFMRTLSLHSVGIDWHEHFDNKVFIECCQELIRLRRHMAPKFLIDGHTYDLSLQQLRVAFIRSKIDKESFVRAIDKLQNEKSKKQKLHTTLLTYINTMTDILYRFASDKEDIKSIYNEMQAFRIIINQQFEKISTHYNCKQYVITERFTFI